MTTVKSSELFELGTLNVATCTINCKWNIIDPLIAAVQNHYEM